MNCRIAIVAILFLITIVGLSIPHHHQIEKTVSAFPNTSQSKSSSIGNEYLDRIFALRNKRALEVSEHSGVEGSSQLFYFSENDFAMLSDEFVTLSAENDHLLQIIKSTDPRYLREVSRTGTLTEWILATMAARKISIRLFIDIGMTGISRQVDVNEFSRAGSFILERVSRDCVNDDLSDCAWTPVRAACECGQCTADQLYIISTYLPSAAWNRWKDKFSKDDFRNSWTFNIVTRYAYEAAPALKSRADLEYNFTIMDNSATPHIAKLYILSKTDTEDVSPTELISEFGYSPTPEEELVFQELIRDCQRKHQSILP